MIEPIENAAVWSATLQWGPSGIRRRVDSCTGTPLAKNRRWAWSRIFNRATTTVPQCRRGTCSAPWDSIPYVAAFGEGNAAIARQLSAATHGAFHFVACACLVLAALFTMLTQT